MKEKSEIRLIPSFICGTQQNRRAWTDQLMDQMLLLHQESDVPTKALCLIHCLLYSDTVPTAPTRKSLHITDLSVPFFWDWVLKNPKQVKLKRFNRIYLCQVKPEACTGPFPSGTKCHSLAEIPFSLHAWQAEGGDEPQKPRRSGQDGFDGGMTAARVDFCLPKQKHKNLQV